MRVFGSGNVRRWIKEGKLKPFPRERERQNTKSATFRSYTEESKTTFKAKSNVQNQKILSSSREATLAYRPPREVEAFVLCPLPRHRRVQACTPQPRRGHKKQELSWKRGKFLLSYIRDITEKDDEIIISYKGGKPCVSFKIEESKAKES